MRRILFSPIDIAPLVFFRIAGGCLIALEIVGQATTEYAGAYVSSEVHFSYLYLEWLRPWPPLGIYVHLALNLVMAVCVTIGLYYRATTVLLFLGSTSLFLMERSVYINHTYLYCLVSFLLIFLPCHRSVSVDAARDATIRAATAPAWCLYLLRFQIAVVYLYAGVAKFDTDWLSALPLEMALQAKADYPVVGVLLASRWLAYFIAWGGLVFDLLIIPALLWRRTRRFAFGAAVVFHLLNVLVFGLGTFPWFALVMTSLFFDPVSFRSLPGLKDRLDPITHESAPTIPSAGGSMSLLALAVYALIQILLPLRPWVYPGNVSWNEHGHIFSWRMMVRAKTGDVTFVVKDPSSKRVWHEHPYRYMTLLQYRKMLGKPDLLLQFAHFLAERYRTRGYPGVKVRVRAKISLNGRPARLLLDPTVDLASESRSLRPYMWIRDRSP